MPYGATHTLAGLLRRVLLECFDLITVNRKFDNAILGNYSSTSSTEVVKEVGDLHHELVRGAVRLADISGGIEITSIADIPSGTGLGSSSSFAVGVLNALFTYTGHRLSGKELAELACRVEIDILDLPIGNQDQYAAVYGRLSYFRFHSDSGVSSNRIDLMQRDWRAMGRRLMLFYTGITRSAGVVLTEQKENTKNEIECEFSIQCSMRLCLFTRQTLGTGDPVCGQSVFFAAELCQRSKAVFWGGRIKEHRYILRLYVQKRDDRHQTRETIQERMW